MGRTARDLYIERGRGGDVSNYTGDGTDQFGNNYYLRLSRCYRPGQGWCLSHVRPSTLNLSSPKH